jgi:carbon-monoxide dehydrogenase medium subunit
MITANFDYESPRTLGEALDLLSSREDAKILAGGHSLLPAMKLRLAQPTLLVDIGRIGGLNYIRESGDQVRIGALTTHAEVAASPLLRQVSPLLALTASQVGDTQVRNRGTLGGSLAQAHPAADYPAAVLTLDAEIVTQSRSGERVLPIANFFTGMFSTQLRRDEILTEVRVPRTTGENVAYKKFHHPASGYAVVGVAVRLKLSGAKIVSAAVGISGVSDSAYRATAVEIALRGKPTSAIAGAAKQAARGVEVIGDVYASAPYRQHLVTVIARRALEQAASGR